MKSRLYALALLTAGTLVSCAVKEETPANENEKAYLEAWIHTHHPDAGKAGMGIYILDDEPAGSGKAVELPCYARVTYTIRDLDGNISSTSDSTVAKQLGEYDKSYYYGPRVWSVHENSLNKGIEDMIVGMTEGSSREAVIPGWLQTYNRYDSEEEYLSKVKDNSPQIYSVKIIEVTDDIIQWQIDTMERYSAKYLDGVDSLFYGFYYKQLSAPVSDETLHTDTTIYINYTGKLLNGQVFDTTDERIAKDNNIYSSSKTYAPVEVTMSADSTEVKLDDSDIITGFARTLWEMKPMEKGIGMFYSEYGYRTSGSGSLIPEYSPLVFEIEIVENPDGEEE